MDEFISDFKQWITDMKDHPEIIGSELANVGGKIFRGVAAVAGGAVEAVGAVGAAAVDITASSIGAESVGEEAAKAIRKPFAKVSDAIKGTAAAATCLVSKAAGDVGGEIESEVEIDVHGSKALKKAFGRSIPLVRGCVLKAYYGLSRSTTGVYVGENEVIALYAGPKKGAFGDSVNEVASIRKVSLDQFRKCAGPAGFELELHVAASANQAMHMDVIADRAMAEYERYGNASAQERGDLPDNCHAFTYYCITGRNHADDSCKEFELDDALEALIGKPVSWRPIEAK
jgi:hypothetical protein